MGPILLKGGSRFFLGITVVLVFLTLVQCSIEKPESPSWTTSIVVPIVNRTYDMDEIIERIDQEGLIVDLDGTVAFSITKELDTVSLSDDNLGTTDLTHSFSQTLGNVPISPPDVDPVTVSLSEIPGVSAAISGGTLPVMDFTVTNAIPTIDDFTTAVITMGIMNCSISNQLGVDLSLVVIGIRDISATPSTLIAVDTFATGIATGVTASLVIDLAGKTLSNQLEVRATCHTLGGPITDIDFRHIQTDLSFPGEFYVSSANAKVPALSPIISYSASNLDLTSGETISSAVLEAGLLSLVITNNTNIPSDLLMAIPQLSSGGTVYSVDTTIPASGTLSLSTNLAEYTLSPTGNAVYVNVAATVTGSGTALVDVASTDGFSIEASLTDLSFASVTGVFASSEASFDNIQQDLDAPDGFDEITLNSASLTLEIDNAVDQPGSLALTLTGSNGKTLSLAGDMAASGASGTSTTTITNPNVAGFLSPMPDQITVNGTVQFGDGVYEGTLTPNDWVAARVSIYAPLDVTIDSAEINDIDLQAEEINQDDIDAIVDHVMSASFTYTMDSHLPLGVYAVIAISGDSASLFLDDLSTSVHPVLQLDPIAVDAAPVSLATGTGVVSESRISTGSITLDNDDIQILKNDTVFVRNRIILTSSDGSGVKLTADDYVTISGSFAVEYFFDGEF